MEQYVASSYQQRMEDQATTTGQYHLLQRLYSCSLRHRGLTNS